MHTNVSLSVSASDTIFPNHIAALPFRFSYSMITNTDVKISLVTCSHS